MTLQVCRTENQVIYCMENEAQEVKVIWKSHGESCSVSWDCDTEH